MASELATFGAGCFWGTEKYFVKNFQQHFPGSLTDVKVGYMGGQTSNPTYKEVCTGKTAHVEVAQVTFDTSKAKFEDLVRFFYSFHDPTTLNRQGNDSGTQYASAIFFHSEEQKKVAQSVTRELDQLLADNKVNYVGPKFENTKVTTGILPAMEFFTAEDYHQKYLEMNPGGYCNHKIRFKWGDKSGL